MFVHYFHSPHHNFGDEINAWIWERLLPGVWDQNEDTQVSGIGTLISDGMPKARKWLVFSSGIGYRPPPKNFGDESWDILCVRGRLTTKALNLPEEKAITDGAILLALLPEYQPCPEDQRHGIVFMPHIGGLKAGNWKKICAQAGLEFISPSDDCKQTLERIRTAKLVVADAMHAAIVADAFRVPWIPVATSQQINSFKWIDWASSMGLPYEPTVLPPSTRLEAIRNLFMRFGGESYLLKNNSEESALEHYRFNRWLKSQFWWASYVALLKKIDVTAIALQKFFHNKTEAPAYPTDAPESNDVVAALIDASRRNPYLSSEPLFKERLSQMKACLEQLRQTIEGEKAR